MNKQYGILTALILLLIAAATGVYFIYQAKYQTAYDALDPDTGLVITVNGVTSGEKLPQTPVYGGALLTKLGISSVQYQKIQNVIQATVTDTYKNTYNQVAINAKSLLFDKSSRTYTFKARLGDIGSTKYIFVTIKMVSDTEFTIEIKDDESKVLKNDNSVKV
ncbi:MAG: hypothetical protein ABIQ04_04430 [Candidatus Saccharimonadales bacterium]